MSLPIANSANSQIEGIIVSKTEQTLNEASTSLINLVISEKSQRSGLPVNSKYISLLQKSEHLSKN